MNSDFRSYEKSGVKYYISPMLENTGMVRHFFSTRTDGRSEGVFSSLNLGIYTEDKKENVEDNMKVIFNAAGMSINNHVYLKQIHSADFKLINGDFDLRIKGSEGDAIITTHKNIPVGVFTADCVPLLILDRVKGIAASVHAGWKGTYNRITQKVTNYMIESLGSAPPDIIAAIGPSIGPCCFKVGFEVAEYFNFKYCKNNEYFVDLWSENIFQITGCGVPRENIDSSNMCSMCNSDLFYSYRRDNGKTGRMGSFIELI